MLTFVEYFLIKNYKEEKYNNVRKNE